MLDENSFELLDFRMLLEPARSLYLEFLHKGLKVWVILEFLALSLIFLLAIFVFTRRVVRYFLEVSITGSEGAR